MKFEFTLVLEGNNLTEDQVNHLYECGCDDALFGVYSGVPKGDFTRYGEEYWKVVKSAINDIEKAGLKVKRVTIAAS